MVNGVNELLTAYMSKNGKKTGDLNVNSDAFQALLAVLMNQGMGMQGNNVSELQGDLTGQIEGMLGANNQGANMTDVFGINPLMMRMMSGVDTGNQGMQFDGSGLKGFEEIIKDLLENAAGGQNPQIDPAQIDELLNNYEMGSDKKEIVQGESTGSNNSADITLDYPEADISQPIEGKVQDAVSNQSVKLIQIPKEPGVELENVAKDRNNVEPANSQGNTDTSGNTDVKVQAAVSVKEEQYIISRPELLKMMKGKNAKIDNAAAGANSQQTFGVDVGSQDGHINAGKEIGDSNNGEAEEKGKEKLDFGHLGTVQFAADNKNMPAVRFHDISSTVYQGGQINKDDVLNQIYDKIKLTGGKDVSELHVSLKPESLGEVSIKLLMDKGIMTARILVENNHVKSLIESNIPQIRESLKSQNLDVVNFSVNVGLGQGDLTNNQNFSSNRWAFNKKGYSRTDNRTQIEEIRLGDVNIQRGALNLLV